MNKYVFFENEFLIRFLAISILVLTYSFTSFLILMCLAILIGAFFRKKQIDYLEVNNADQGLLLAPISGEVIEIIKTESSFKLIIKSDFKNEFGVYLPSDAEVEKAEILSIGSKLKRNRVLIGVKNKLMSYQVKFTCKFSYFKPKVWLQAGDIGKAGANIGYLPFGGSADLILPNSLDVLVKPGDKIISCQTILASMESKV
jgi:hypothetical protein